MPTVKTTRFGEIPVEPDQVYAVSETLPGFPDAASFFFIDRANIAPFRWLQCIEDANLTFVIVKHEIFFYDYAPKVDPKDLKGLEMEDQFSGQFYTIVVLPEDLTQMTANLKAPLLFNPRTRKFKQVFLLNSDYHYQHYILRAIEEKGIEGSGAGGAG